MVDTVSLPVDVTTQKIIPDWYTGPERDILAAQIALMNKPFQAYVDAQGRPIQRFAELTPLQQASIEATTRGANIFRPELNLASQQEQNIYGRSASENIKGALSALGATATGAGMTAAKPYIEQGANTQIVGTAQPYANRAGATTVQDIQQYMNPYTQEVVYRLGDIGARSLREQLLPEIMKRYISSGQGLNPSGRSVDEARALRDTYEAVLNKQAQLLQEGYTQAAGLSAADLARYGQLAGTMGNLAADEATAKLNAGQALGTIGTAEERISADVAQQQLDAMAAAYGQDTANQMAAATGLKNIAQQRQDQEMAAANALMTAGGVQQALDQKALDFQRAEFERAQGYPQSQINAATSTVGNLAAGIPVAEQKKGTESQMVPGTSTGSTIAGGLALVDAATGGKLSKAIGL